MTQNSSLSNDTLRTAMYELALASKVPEADVLDDMIRQFPQHADELTEFAVDLALEVLEGDDDVVVAVAAINPEETSPAVSRALSHFQNRLFLSRQKNTSASDPVRQSMSINVLNPFMRLSREEFRNLANRLDVSTTFVSKLRDRQIDPATMPASFPVLVADELDVPLDAIMAHFVARRSTTMAGQHFKADSKPNDGGQQSFRDAVCGSGLSEAQQQRLLSL